MIRFIVSCAFGFAVMACAQTSEPTASLIPTSERGDVADGLRLAETHCANCHAIGSEGDSAHPMAPPFRTLSRDYPVNALEEAFAEGVLVGHPDMPEFRFEPAQIDALVAYLESVQVRRGG
jgi:mono/diheme cytochrome c family protein